MQLAAWLLLCPLTLLVLTCLCLDLSNGLHELLPLPFHRLQLDGQLLVDGHGLITKAPRSVVCGCQLTAS
jgi:hypothetical protein